VREGLFCTKVEPLIKTPLNHVYAASFIRRGGLDGLHVGFQRLGSRREGAEKPSSDGRAEAVVRGLVPRTYRPGAPGALGGSAPSKGELAVKRPPDTATPLKADMEPVQSVPTMKGAQR